MGEFLPTKEVVMAKVYFILLFGAALCWSACCHYNKVPDIIKLNRGVIYFVSQLQGFSASQLALLLWAYGATV